MRLKMDHELVLNVNAFIRNGQSCNTKVDVNYTSDFVIVILFYKMNKQFQHINDTGLHQ